MTVSPARLVNDALDAIVAGERADRVLTRTLRANRHLTSADRARVAEWTLGVSLWRGRLDHLARGDRSLWLGLFLVDREHRSPTEAAQLSDVPAAALEAALMTPAPADAIERLAFTRSLPLWLARRWVELWGLDRADRLAAAMNERGPIGIRANLHRTTAAALSERLATEGVSSRPSKLAESALLLDGRPNIVALSSWRDGLFEVQDEGSQLIAAAVHAKPGETIVDLCAGSGGKTLALAAAMQNDGRIVAVDSDPQRLVDLEVRARRAGVTCIETRIGDGRDASLLYDLAPRVDAVLVDAPCSAMGTLRRGPDARWRMTPHDSARWAPVQAALLHVAAQVVSDGGRVVYATCSLDPSENEEVSRPTLHKGFKLENEVTTYPDVEGCDGFYWSEWKCRRSS